jgi:serine protease
MTKHELRRYAVGALAVGALTVAGAAMAAAPTKTPPAEMAAEAAGAWRPVVHGLTERPAKLLPATISTARPVRVVSTTVDPSGRPVVTTRTATDRATATGLVETAQHAANAIGVELDAEVTAADVPGGTDPYRSQQWDLDRLRVADAWPKATGAGVTVAVIDTGVDASHPDLAGQVLPGVDFVDGTEGTATDENGHGTHVAGTIAAITGNGAGVSAVAPDARILPVRVLGANGTGYMSDAASGIVYAADHGADVINMSLGTDTQVDAVTNAIAYARSKGAVVVAAAGNQRTGGSPASYPAADSGVIAVAATDSADAVAYYSTRGDYVDVAAPGSGIVSTYPGGSYRTMNGTSMATPHVAAVAALLKSYHAGLSPDAVEQALETSATDLGPAGKDADFGYGRIDAAAALAAVAPSAPQPPALATTEPVTPATSEPTTPPAGEPTTPPAGEPTTPPAGEPTTPPAGEPSAPAPTETPTAVPTVTTDPTAAAPSATPTPEPALLDPVVTPNATARLVKYGSTPTALFTVRADGRPWAGRPVSVCVSLNGAAFQCAGRATDAAGTVAWPQRATTPFRIRLVVAATGISREVTSSTAVYKIQAAATVTRADAKTLAVAIGGVDGQTVQVQRLDGTHWVTAKTLRAAARSTVTGLTPGSQYRVVVPATTVFAGTTSTVVKL